MSDIKRVTVIGSGTMGHGIAHVAAAAGFEVRLNDVDGTLVERGLDAIRANLDKGVAKGKVSAAERAAALSRIRGETDLDAAAGDADLVVEAVPEKIELKREIFHRIDEVAPATAVLASNTSSLSIAEIGRATGRAERVVGMVIVRG